MCMQLPQKLRRELERHWPSLLDRKGTGFWTHEWNKHGSIASGVMDAKAYFSKAAHHFKVIAIDVIIHRGIIFSHSNKKKGLFCFFFFLSTLKYLLLNQDTSWGNRIKYWT